MPYQIILFDLDDTLIDFAASEAIGLQAIYEQYYSNTKRDLFQKVYKEINKSLWCRVGAQENPLMPSDVRLLRFQQLNEQIQCEVPVEQVASLYEEHLNESVDWLPNVKKAVEFLHSKGHILGIITNGISDLQGKKQQRLGLHSWFDCFVVSDEVGIAKPHKKIFEIAMDQIATKYQQPRETYNKDRILMVGDSLISDGYGAMNYGIHYCHIATHGEAPINESTPVTYQLKSVAHLPKCMGYAEEYSFV